MKLTYSVLLGLLLSMAVAAGSTFAQAPQTLPVPNACSQQPGGPPPCRDSDGDGLCDSWELAKQLPNGIALPDADPNRPDIYVQYAYMGWGEPGTACVQDSDCTAGGAQPNLVCHENRCNHNHKPDPQSLQIVVDSFARHGVALHIDSNPLEVPHSEVITWARAGDDDNGPKAVCAGADLQSGVLGGFAVSFHDIKASYFDPKRQSVYHYTVFSHSVTCLTDAPGALTGNCGRCPTDRATPPGLPAAGSSGLSELPGNDVVVSLGQSFYNPLGSVRRNPFIEAGVFMHELGHNLGLHHAGDLPAPDSMPNYLSVMNNRYVLSGILQADAVGSSLLVTCNTDADCSSGAKCRAVPSGGGRCTRIDYSSSTLNTLDETSLDEATGVSSLDSGLRDTILYTDSSNLNRRGPAAGPVDWTGDGVINSSLVTVDLNGQVGTSEVMRGFNDWDHGACRTNADCRINAIRQAIHDLVDPSLDSHEPCVQNKCQSLWYPFQCTQWGKKD